jgi:hypothetical protein
MNRRPEFSLFSTGLSDALTSGSSDALIQIGQRRAKNFASAPDELTLHGHLIDSFDACVQTIQYRTEWVLFSTG